MTEGPVAAPGGRIVTFYSFKGGVGRTMALANVAFLAAMNGKRVLVMDWDLEAPGLAYYFRGMQDTSAAKAIRAAPGILNLVWDWSTALHGATTLDDASAVRDRFVSGEPFEAMLSSLLPDFEDPDGGVLHHIGAGNAEILAPEPVAYEEALARFDWSNFFTEEAGGVLLSALRNWAKDNYDYVFLDSRTGFADVAGICTMQLPDLVALCYIYNRQNIDGIAQVAGAIRDKRGEEIALRAVPMRVSRENTSEEADARARARKELVRKGRFLGETVDIDQKVLAIKQAPNVPFYETIALITSDRPRSDPLALDYLNLACQLLDADLQMPQMFEGWIDRVRRRLQSRQAAPDYLLGLRGKEPARAIDEVTQLIENALEEGIGDEGDRDYIHALVTTATHLARTTSSAHEVENLSTLTLDLLRDLALRDPGRWKPELADFIESYLEQMAPMLDEDDELLLLDEADAILATRDGDIAKLRRVENRRRAARIQVTLRHTDTAAQITAELATIVGDISSRVTGEARLDLLAAEMDIALLRGDISLWQGKIEAAKRLFEVGLKIPVTREAGNRPELSRLRFDLHIRLARLDPDFIAPAEAARHALEALDWTGSSNSFVLYVSDLGGAVLRAQDPKLLEDFVSRAFRSHERRQSQFVFYHGRNPRATAKFVTFVQAAAKLVIETREAEPALVILLDQLTSILPLLLERALPRNTNDLGAKLEQLMQLLSAGPRSLNIYSALLRPHITAFSRKTRLRE